MRQMTEKDYIELERKQRDRTLRTEAAFRACEELIRGGYPGQTSPFYPAYNYALRALGRDKT